MRRWWWWCVCVCVCVCEHNRRVETLRANFKVQLEEDERDERDKLHGRVALTGSTSCIRTGGAKRRNVYNYVAVYKWYFQGIRQAVYKWQWGYVDVQRSKQNILEHDRTE
jgi:hypothetical protein